MNRFDGITPRGVYVKQCQALGCRKNVSLLRSLSDNLDGFNQLTELDLTHHLIGRVGFGAILEVIRIGCNLRRLCLANNGLDDACILSLLAAIKGHTELVYVDLSSNPLGRSIGKELVHFVRVCNQIQWLLLEETLISQSVHQMIDKEVLENRRLAAEKFNASNEYGRGNAGPATPARGPLLVAEVSGQPRSGPRVRRVQRGPPEPPEALARVLGDDRWLQAVARQEFRRADVHGLGCLTVAELGLAMRHAVKQLGLASPPAHEVAVALDLLDSDQSGRLTEDEFLHAVRMYLVRRQKAPGADGWDDLTEELLREDPAPRSLSPGRSVSPQGRWRQSPYPEVGVDDLDTFGSAERRPSRRATFEARREQRDAGKREVEDKIQLLLELQHRREQHDGLEAERRLKREREALVRQQEVEAAAAALLLEEENRQREEKERKRLEQQRRQEEERLEELRRQREAVEAEERTRREAEERQRREAERQRREVEERQRREAEEGQRREAERKRREKEEQKRREAAAAAAERAEAERQRREAEERARWQGEVQRWEEEARRREAEGRRRLDEIAELRRRKEEELLRLEAEMQRRRQEREQEEAQVRREEEERVRLEEAERRRQQREAELRRLEEDLQRQAEEARRKEAARLAALRQAAEKEALAKQQALEEEQRRREEEQRRRTEELAAREKQFARRQQEEQERLAAERAKLEARLKDLLARAERGPPPEEAAQTVPSKPREDAGAAPRRPSRDLRDSCDADRKDFPPVSEAASPPEEGAGRATNWLVPKPGLGIQLLLSAHGGPHHAIKLLQGEPGPGRPPVEQPRPAARVEAGRTPVVGLLPNLLREGCSFTPYLLPAGHPVPTECQRPTMPFAAQPQPGIHALLAADPSPRPHVQLLLPGKGTPIPTVAAAVVRKPQPTEGEGAPLTGVECLLSAEFRDHASLRYLVPEEVAAQHPRGLPGWPGISHLLSADGTTRQHVQLLLPGPGSSQAGNNGPSAAITPKPTEAEEPPLSGVAHLLSAEFQDHASLRYLVPEEVAAQHPRGLPGWPGISHLLSADGAPCQHVQLLLPGPGSSQGNNGPSAAITPKPTEAEEPPLSGVAHLLSAEFQDHASLRYLVPEEVAAQHPRGLPGWPGISHLLPADGASCRHVQLLLPGSNSQAGAPAASAGPVPVPPAPPAAPLPGVGHLLTAGPGPCPHLRLLLPADPPPAACVGRPGLTHLFAADPATPRPFLRLLVGDDASASGVSIHGPGTGAGQPAGAPVPHVELLVDQFPACPALRFLSPEQRSVVCPGRPGLTHLLSADGRPLPHLHLLVPGGPPAPNLSGGGAERALKARPSGTATAAAPARSPLDALQLLLRLLPAGQLPTLGLLAPEPPAGPRPRSFSPAPLFRPKTPPKEPLAKPATGRRRAREVSTAYKWLQLHAAGPPAPVHT